MERENTRSIYLLTFQTEWGWFHCIYGSVWGRYGVESGAAWHRALQNRYWLYDGLIGKDFVNDESDVG